MIKIKKQKSLLIFLVVLILLLFLHGVGALRPLENALVWLTKPVATRLHDWGAGFNRSYSERRAKTDLTARVAALQNEVAQLTVNQAGCQDLSAENQKLRSQLQFLNNNNYRAVSAALIAQDLDNQGEGNQVIIINRGAKDGLRVGLAVVGSDGTIVGKISDVKDLTAQACLVTSPNCTLAAAVQNDTRTVGVTDGDLGLTVRMDYIPPAEKLSVGDIVVSSGLGGNIPHGLVIGRIKSISNPSNEVWQSATIEPLENFSDLTVVAVIIP